MAQSNNFKIVSLAELKIILDQFVFKRKIVSLHIHHTYSPDISKWNKNPDGMYWQRVMERYHIGTRKFNAIAQHLTLLPDGNFVTGRDFNLTPASASGFNDGAFMIEMIGNFDKGYDVLGGKQASAIYEFCSFFVEKFGIGLEGIKFHREFPGAGKTCPGTGIDKNTFLQSVMSIRKISQQNELKEAIDIINNAKIITDKALWMGKANTDINIWYLLTKTAKYLKEKGINK